MPGELSHWLFDAGDVDAIASLLSELQSPSVRELQLKSALPLALALSSQTTATRIAKWFGTNIP
jgi:hypothetical protein